MKRILSFCILSAALLASCSNPREKLGLRKTAPDEFKVLKNAPLEIPANLTLPQPRPGAPRPQEIAVAEQAKETLFGDRAATAAQQITQAESALLQQAGANQSQDDIRRLIDSEQGEVDTANQSVTQRLLGFGGEDKNANVLNAKEEAERLEKSQNGS